MRTNGKTMFGLKNWIKFSTTGTFFFKFRNYFGFITCVDGYRYVYNILL